MRLPEPCPAVSHQRSTVRAAKYDGTSIRDGNPVDRRGAARGTSEAVLWISEAILWVSKAILWTDGERCEGSAKGLKLIATRPFAALRLRVTHKGDIPCKPYGVPTSSNGVDLIPARSQHALIDRDLHLLHLDRPSKVHTDVHYIGALGH